MHMWGRRRRRQPPSTQILVSLQHYFTPNVSSKEKLSQFQLRLGSKGGKTYIFIATHFKIDSHTPKMGCSGELFSCNRIRMTDRAINWMRRDKLNQGENISICEMWEKMSEMKELQLNGNCVKDMFVNYVTCVNYVETFSFLFFGRFELFKVFFKILW